VRRAHTLCHRVDTIALHSFSVANEHSWSASIIKLANVVELLDIDEAAEHSQVADPRLAPMPSLVWSHPVERLGGSAAGLDLPLVTGRFTAVTGLTGLDRLRYRPVTNR
jgi:hypothetical protein